LEFSESYQRQMAAILAGAQYRDQSTPLAAILTQNCAMVRKDEHLMVECSYKFQRDHAARDAFLKDPVKEAWSSEPYFVEGMAFLSAPVWPNQPAEGQLHPIFMSYPGTLIRRDMRVVVFHDGKWYVLGNSGNPRYADVSVFDRYK